MHTLEPPTLALISVTAAALLAGIAIGWLIAAQRSAADRARLTEKETQLQQALSDYDQARAARDVANDEHVRAAAELAAQRLRLDEQRADLEHLKSAMVDTFTSLAGTALEHNTAAFLERAARELGPTNALMADLKTNLSAIEQQRASAYADMKTRCEQIGQDHQRLQSETAKLVTALRQPGTRGRWGEIQLRRVVEMAGMVDHVDFVEQKQFGDGETVIRPDMRVNLPSGTMIVVDAKTPLDAYLQAIDTADPATRDSLLGRYARDVRAHIDHLASKSYWRQFERSPDFVVMFLPGENFYATALERDPTLIEYGVENQIVIATPTTLIGLLRAVYFGWCQISLAENAEQVSALGKELYDGLARLAANFKKFRNALDGTVRTFNNVVGTLEGSVLVGARRFRNLGAARAGKEIPRVRGIEQEVRALQSPETDATADGKLAGEGATLSSYTDAGDSER